MREHITLSPVTHNVVLGRRELDRLLSSQVGVMIGFVKLIDSDRGYFGIVKLGSANRVVLQTVLGICQVEGCTLTIPDHFSYA